MSATSSAPDPAYIQKNIESLSRIGGVYDLLAAIVEADHIEILTPYRLDTGAKSLSDLFASRDHWSEHQHTEKERNHAEDDG